MLVTTKRDRDLFEILYSYGLLSTRQIERRLFHNVDSRTCFRRLRKLSRARYIARFSGLKLGLSVWSLDSRGARVIGKETVVSGVNKNVLEHDITLNDVRLRMEEACFKRNWVSGHLLKAKMGTTSQDKVIPDYIFSVATKNGAAVIAVELEVNAKSKRRYRELLGDYRYKKSIGYIWYLVPSETIMRSIYEAAQKCEWTKEQPKIVWTLIDELLDNPLEAWIHNDKSKIYLKDIWIPEPLKVPTTPAHQPAHEVGTEAQPTPVVQTT